MYTIFNEFIPAFVNNSDDEDSLVDCISGMSELSKKTNPTEFLILIAGLKDQDQSLIQIMCEMLKKRNEHVFSGALRYFGGITSSDDKRIPTVAVKN